MDVAAYLYLSSVLLTLFVLGVILRFSCKENVRQARQQGRNRDNPDAQATENSTLRNIQFIDCSQQEQNIYNISGRVPNSNSAQYPDAYLSVEHIAITNELNKPPKYDDAPPSYEEALKLALAQSNSLQTFQAEQPQVHQAASSTSSSTPVVVSAIPSRTTE